MTRRKAIKGLAHRPRPRLHEPRSVTRHLVDLDVDAVARLAFAPVVLQRVRDQQQLERIALDRVHGERGSVERD